jgi:hypothetical protein
MYRYETHLHTYPVSACAHATVRENLEAYKALGFDGVFITNHFLDGNIGIDHRAPYETRINFYFSDYEEAKRIGEEIGIAVFDGLEMSFAGTDFLVYGLHKDWFLAHPEYESMPKTTQLPYFMEHGALVIQAHPYREAAYIDHIRLFPRSVHGVEVFNACRTDLENRMALHYADSYGLIHFHGSDDHTGGHLKRYGGMETDTPLVDEADFVRRVLDGRMKPFMMEAPL